jgi:AraC-like DNA-binding protein
MHHSLPDGEKAPSAPSLRVSAAWGLPQVLLERNVSIGDALEQAGLAPDLFSDRENPISYPELERLLLVCERLCQCDYLGFHIGERSRLADMGLAGRIALCQVNAGEGLRAFIDHFNLHDTAATVTLIESDKYVRFVYAISERGLRDTRHFQLGGITIAWNIVQDLCGRNWLPVGVTFASRTPSNPRALQRYMRAPVQFDADESAVVFARHWLATPLAPVSTADRQAALQEVRQQRSQQLADFPTTLRRMLRKQLLLGRFSMDDISSLLGMHRRTLDRHLKQNGVHYGELVESLKEDVARQLLLDTTMPIQQIAETVRFSSAANFATAFRRRSGMTPSAFRRSGGLSHPVES